MKLSQLNTNTLTRQFNAGHTLCLRGAPGIAKTQTVEQFCAKQELGIVTEFTPAMDAPDAMGFLIPTKSEAGPVAMYSKPNWLRRIEEAIEAGFDSGILFLDEYLSADHLVQKAFAPLMSEGRIGEWKLPDGWVVWIAGNRTIDKAGANKMLSHIGGRMCVIDVTPDLDAWTVWANKTGIHPMYVAFAQARPGVVFSTEPTKNPDEQRMSPRSLTYAHDFHVGANSDMELDTDPITQGMVAGYIGDAATGELFGFLKTVEELPTIDEIIASPLTAKLPNSARLDAQFAAVQMCVYHVDGDNIDPLFEYICRLNKELQASAAKQMIDKTKGTLLNSRALGKWIGENPALIANTFA